MNASDGPNARFFNAKPHEKDLRTQGWARMSPRTHVV